MDEALSDYADWAYLAGEKAEHGEKLKAALAALHPLVMPPRIRCSIEHFVDGDERLRVLPGFDTQKE